MKRAVVIGATSGIGHSVAKILIADGWRVGLAGRRVQILKQMSDAAGHDVCVMPLDVTSEEAPQKLLELIEMLGGINLLFYASGIGKQNMELDLHVELATCNTNVMGFTRMIDTAYNYMAANEGGHIAVVSSIAGTKGLGAAPSYSATKAFQATYIQALEQQASLRSLPISFTDIRPGFVNTPLLAGGGHYPMMMNVDSVARDIMRAIAKQRHVQIIDRCFRLLTKAWRMIPDCIWRRMKIKG